MYLVQCMLLLLSFSHVQNKLEHPLDGCLFLEYLPMLLKLEFVDIALNCSLLVWGDLWTALSVGREYDKNSQYPKHCKRFKNCMGLSISSQLIYCTLNASSSSPEKESENISDTQLYVQGGSIIYCWFMSLIGPGTVYHVVSTILITASSHAQLLTCAPPAIKRRKQ